MPYYNKAYVDVIQRAVVLIKNTEEYKLATFNTIRKAIIERDKSERGNLIQFINDLKQPDKELEELRDDLKKKKISTHKAALKLSAWLANTLRNPLSGPYLLKDKYTKPREIIGTSTDLVTGVLTTTHLVAHQVPTVASALVGLSHVGVLTSLCPLTMVLSPLCSLTAISLMASRNYALKDVKEESDKGRIPVYQCTKKWECKKALDFIIDRDDGKIGRIGIAATVVGAVPVLLYTLGRKTVHKFQGENSEKHKFAKCLWDAAQVTGKFEDGNIEIETAGCPLATTIIATLFEEFAKGTCFINTIAAIAGQDGIERIKRTIN